MQRFLLHRRLLIAAVMFAFACPAVVTAQAEEKTEEKKTNKWTEKIHSISFAGQPWDQVFTWLTKTSGLPMVTKIKPPGTFSLVSPPGAKYSINGVVDLINEVLSPDGFLLVRRKHSWTIITADKEFDASLLQEIEPDELPDRADSELVAMIVPAAPLIAEDVQVPIKRILGKFGSVSALPGTNQLIMHDEVKRLRRVLRIIDSLKKGGLADSYSKVCEYIPARRAKRILIDLLGDPSGPRPDPRDPRRTLPGPDLTNPEVAKKIHHITCDEVSNTILVTGPPNIVSKAKSIVETRLDIPVYPSQPKRINGGQETARSYTVPLNHAVSLATALKEKFKSSDTIFIDAVDNSTLSILALPNDHITIAKILADEGSIVIPALVGVGAMDATDVATTLNSMFGTDLDAEKAATLFIEAQIDRNAILVRGSAEQVQSVKEAIGVIIGRGEAVGGVPNNTRIITLEKGSASTLAEALRQLLPSMRPNNPVQILGGGTERPKLPEPMPMPMPQPMPKDPEGKKPDDGGMSSKDKGKKQSKVLPIAFFEPTPRKAKQPVKGLIQLAPVGGRLMIISDDPKALEMATQLARHILRSDATTGDYAVIPLKHAPAAKAAEVIDEVFNGRRLSTLQGRGGAGSNALSFLNLYRAQNVNPPSDPRQERVRVVADETSNSLLVKASTLDLMTIRKLLDKAIDSGKNESKIVKKLHALGPLKHADATDVALLLKDVYQANTKETPVAQTREGFRGIGFLPVEADTTKSKEATLWIGVDKRTNSLVVHCSDMIFADIKQVVEQLDEGARKTHRVVKVIPLRGLDPEVVKQAIEALQGKKGDAGSGRRNSIQPRREPPGTRPGTGSGPDARGPDFFDPAVKEDQKISLLHKTPQRRTSPNYLTKAASRSLLKGTEEAQQIQSGPSVVAPRSDVTIVPLAQLRAIILRTNNPEDARIIQELINIILAEAKQAEIIVEMVELRHGDAKVIATILNDLFSRLEITPQGNTSTLLTGQGTGGFGGQTQQGQSTWVALIPVPRFNSLLVATSIARMDDVKTHIKRLDKPTTPQRRAKPFPLKRAAAARVAQLIGTFYFQRYGDTTNEVRITYDDSTNTVFIQASPADMTDIERMINHIDNMKSVSENDLVIYPLRAAYADEIANILIQVITKNVLPPSVPVPPIGAGTQNTGVAGAGGIQGGGGQQGLVGAAGLQGGQAGLQGGLAGQQGLGGGAGITGATALGVTTKTSALNLQLFDAQGNPLPPVASGMLEDVQITPYLQNNVLIISAPKKSMDLIIKLVEALDVPPAARAEINVFPLKKADATTVANLLATLFAGQAPAQGGTQPTSGAIIGPGGERVAGAQLVPVNVTADPRTNSIIAVGSVNDLAVVDAIITKLEDFDAPERKFYVYTLKNSTAADVQNALNNFIPNAIGVNPIDQTTYQQFQKQVVVVAEPITNKLLISATPRYFADVLRMIEELDAQLPQVVIQVLVAEVDLNNNQEFGVEFGLQTPLLFDRGLGGGDGTTGALSPGFSFNDPAQAFGNTNLISPSAIGFQALNSFGVGRVSAQSGIGGFVFAAQNDAVNVLIRALKTQQRVDILSRPQITTLDNQAARILIGQNFPIPGQLSQGINSTLQSVEYVPVGVQLQVIPKISPEGRVTMRVIPEISSVGALVPVGGITAPAFNVQTVETTVSVMDGETIVIGGLVTTNEQKTENKVPLLGDLPGIGSLFRFRTQLKMKQELIVILTPHIVRTRAEADRILAQESRRMDWILGDVVKMHGTTGLEPILPQPGPQLPPTGPDGMMAPPMGPGSGEYCPPGNAPGAPRGHEIPQPGASGDIPSVPPPPFAEDLPEPRLIPTPMPQGNQDNPMPPMGQRNPTGNPMPPTPQGNQESPMPPMPPKKVGQVPSSSGISAGVARRESGNAPPHVGRVRSGPIRSNSLLQSPESNYVGFPDDFRQSIEGSSEAESVVPRPVGFSGQSNPEPKPVTVQDQAGSQSKTGGSRWRLFRRR